MPNKPLTPPSAGVATLRDFPVCKVCSGSDTVVA